jgi:hypothetical protein
MKWEGRDGIYICDLLFGHTAVLRSLLDVDGHGHHRAEQRRRFQSQFSKVSKLSKSKLIEQFLASAQCKE